MADTSKIKAQIAETIYTNGQGAITAAAVRDLLTSMVDELAGPGTPDWYASEGSDGYIKNRTHSLDDYKGTLNTNNTSVNLIGGEVIYAQKGSTIKELWEGDEWDIELWDESQGKLFAVKVTNTGLNVTLTGDVSHLTSNIGIYGELTQIPEAYIPDSIARHFYIEELYAEVTELWGLNEWPTIDGTALMNSLDRGLTLDELMALGFPAKIRECPHDIKGILIENPTSEGYSKQRLPLMYASEDEHGVNCVSFGHISRAAYGSELDVSFEDDGTCYLTYTEA